MTLILVGLNHRTAPVELREKLSLAGCGIQMALDDLRSFDHQQLIQEAVILSTCNRLELYAIVSGDVTAAWSHLDHYLAGLQGIDLAELQAHLYHYTDHTVVQHVMRVTCGLDSMILGESQILGQVGDAFHQAKQHGFVRTELFQLMSRALHTGKRARTETAINRHTTSVSHAGALMVAEKTHQAQPKVLIVGVGEMAVLAAKSLHKRQDADLAFINRTHHRAEALAANLGGHAITWHDLPQALVWADAVITATGAPHTIIHAQDLAQVMPQRQARPLLFVDIAVPRDVEIEVEQYKGVQRYDIDDLQTIVDANAAQRQAAVPDVERIIAEECEAYQAWRTSRHVAPVITDLRRWANEIAQQEVMQALNKLGEVDHHTEEVVNRLAHRLVNKLLHKPTMQLRGNASDDNYADMVSELFGLQTDISA